MRLLVTGGAGFIGSRLCDALIERGHDVTVIDDLSGGSKRNLPSEARFIPGDILAYPLLEEEIRKNEAVFHFAANADVRSANQRPGEYLTSHLDATIRIASAMRPGQVLVFASSSTVYGEVPVVPTPESYGPCEPISIYGGMKLACESVISGLAHLRGFKGVILRYANIVGPSSGHGVMKDFFAKLSRDQNVLEVLGDGTQKKSYCWIDDCVSATIDAWSESTLSDSSRTFEVYNVGSRDSISVVDVARIVSDAMRLRPQFRFVPYEGGRGWKGDVKNMQLDVSKIAQVSKAIKRSSAESVRECARGIVRRSSL
jgi:UDP-glucose 4-epimerase